MTTTYSTRETARRAEDAYSAILDRLAAEGVTSGEEYDRTYRLWHEAFEAMTDGRM